MDKRTSEWLDKIIAEQAKVDGPYVAKLIERAAQATEVYSEDSLERFSKRQKERSAT